MSDSQDRKTLIAPDASETFGESLGRELSKHVRLRLADPGDTPYIAKTWLDGVYYGNDWFRQIPRKIFLLEYPQIISFLLTKSQVSLFCLKEERSAILSYVVIQHREPDLILHWAYTNPPWRNLGLAKRLIPKSINTCSHLTKMGKSLKPPKWAFNPFLK